MLQKVQYGSGGGFPARRLLRLCPNQPSTSLQLRSRNNMASDGFPVACQIPLVVVLMLKILIPAMQLRNASRSYDVGHVIPGQLPTNAEASCDK